VAVGHRWSEKERVWLGDYTTGWRNVAILDALPADWTPKGNDEPGWDDEPGHRVATVEPQLTGRKPITQMTSRT
jgi:hypothetical protein